MITYFEAETETVIGTAVERLLSSASETTGVLLFIWVGRKFELSAVHEKIDVLNGPNAAQDSHNLPKTLAKREARQQTIWR